MTHYLFTLLAKPRLSIVWLRLSIVLLLVAQHLVDPSLVESGEISYN